LNEDDEDEEMHSPPLDNFIGNQDDEKEAVELDEVVESQPVIDYALNQSQKSVSKRMQSQQSVAELGLSQQASKQKYSAKNTPKQFKDASLP